MLLSYMWQQYAPECPHICTMCQLVNLQISDTIVSIYTSYQLKTTKTITTNTGIHIFHIIGICPKEIFLSHHPGMSHCPLIVLSTCGLHITTHPSQKQTQTATCIYSTITIYVPYNNYTPLKCDICQLLHVHISDN